jgi:hypothetical protein
VTALTSKRHIQVDLAAIFEAVRNSLGAIAGLAQIFKLSPWNLIVKSFRQATRTHQNAKEKTEEA